MFRSVLIWLVLCSISFGQTSSNILPSELQLPKRVFELQRLEQSPDGTVLRTRNIKESDNSSPGYWNHLANLSNGHIVEAQAGQGVIRTSFEVFLARPYSRIQAFKPVNLREGEVAADTSETLFGLPFRQFSSLPGKDRPRAMQRGINCDSNIRFIYRQASGQRLRRMRIPDRLTMMVDRGILLPPITIR